MININNFIKEFKIIDENVQNKIYDHIKNDKQDMNQSQVYSKMDNEKMINTEMRLSNYKTLINTELFYLVNELHLFH